MNKTRLTLTNTLIIFYFFFLVEEEVQSTKPNIIKKIQNDQKNDTADSGESQSKNRRQEA